MLALTLTFQLIAEICKGEKVYMYSDKLGAFTYFAERYYLQLLSRIKNALFEAFSRASKITSHVIQDYPPMTSSTGSQPIRSKTASWQRTLATIPTFKDFHATSSLRPQPTLSRLVPLEQSRSRHSKRTFLVKMIYNVGLSHRRRFRLGLSESEKCRIFPHTPGDPWTSMDMQSRPIVNLRRVHSRSTTWSCARLYALLPNHRDPLLCGPQYLPERFFTSSLLANTHQTINQSGPSNRFLFKRKIVVAICDEELDSEV